jgi:hypothetical protein
MNVIDKIQNLSRSTRIIIGIVSIAIGYILSDGTLSWSWWYLGALSLIVGLTNICPLCMITKKCSIGSRR